MKKLWYTPAELAALKLPAFPHTRMGIKKRFEKAGCQEHPIKSRRRTDSGGGREYHVALLPNEAQNAIALRSLKNDSTVLEASPQAEYEVLQTPSGNGGLRRDAKMTILMVWDAFLADSTDGVEIAQFSFVTLYKSQKIAAMPEWVYLQRSTFSVGSLKNWIKARSNGEINSLAGNYGNRKGTSLLDTAFDGKVAKYITAQIINQPHLNAGHIRDLLRAEFGDPWEVTAKGQKTFKGLPNIRNIQRWINAYKKTNEELITKITDPDKWKNKYMVAPGSANAWVNAPNQLWEIDASPVDGLCVDGRYNLYCVIDIYTRRMKILISRTPTTTASLLLIRKAIMDWGVPETIRTDNGSDFVSHAFVRALTHLGIRQDIAAPFTPEHKGTVERAIGTFQRGCMPLLPGFIGHNVTDRKKIEGRRSFAQRLGEKADKAFSVELTSTELQEYADKWVENKYHHNEHGGLKGSTPYQMATAWTGPVKRIENEAALHIMLAEVPGKSGLRTVTKKGISIEGITYWHDLFMVGQKYHIRFDPDDMGRVHCFSEDHDEFVCTAENDQYSGVNPIAAAAAAKATQRERLKEGTSELRRETRKYKPRHAAEAILGQAAQDTSNLVAFPGKSENYTTPAIEAALEASFSKTLDLPIEPNNAAEHYQQALIDQEKVTHKRASISVVDEGNERYVRAKKLQALVENGMEIDAADKKWLDGYLDSAEYRTRALMEQDFGENFFESK